MSDNNRHDSRMDSVYLSYLPDESGSAAKAAMQGQGQAQQNVAPIPRPQAQPPMQSQQSGIRPLQLRQPQQQRPQMQPGMQRPNIPILQVTVPPPVHGGNYAAVQQNSPFNPAHSPYPPSTPRSGSPFSSSTDTLIGSPSGEKKIMWSPSSSINGSNPPMSPSIRNLQLAIPIADKTADPDNDRLMPATPGLGGQRDWWKRFSYVVRENQEQEMMAEKVHSAKGSSSPGAAPHASTSNRNKPRSQWLDKEGSSQRNYRIWVGVVAFCIIAAIAGGLAYHYVTKNPNAGETLPAKKDFGLGTLSDEDSSTSEAFADPVTDAENAASASTGRTTSQLPAPSAVAAGATLRIRAAAAGIPEPTAIPVSASSHGHEKRRIVGAHGASGWHLN